MLIYHQRNDVFHCMFRLLSILHLLDEKKIEIDRLKIIDFFFVFPHLIADTPLPRAKGSAAIKKEACSLAVPYENLPSSKILFSEMGDFQLQALDILRSKEIVSFFDDGWLTIGSTFESESITKLVSGNSFTSNEFYKSLETILCGYKMHGSNGLKSKTGLMEYRYDAV